MIAEAEAIDRVVLQRYQTLAIDVIRDAALCLAYSTDSDDTTEALQFLTTQTPWHNVLGMDAEEVHEAIVRPIIEKRELPLSSANGGRGNPRRLTADNIQRAIRIYNTGKEAADALGVCASSLERAMIRENVERPAKWRRAAPRRGPFTRDEIAAAVEAADTLDHAAASLGTRKQSVTRAMDRFGIERPARWYQ